MLAVNYELTPVSPYIEKCKHVTSEASSGFSGPSYLRDQRRDKSNRAHRRRSPSSPSDPLSSPALPFPRTVIAALRPVAVVAHNERDVPPLLPLP